MEMSGTSLEGPSVLVYPYHDIALSWVVATCVSLCIGIASHRAGGRWLLLLYCSHASDSCRKGLRLSHDCVYCHGSDSDLLYLFIILCVAVGMAVTFSFLVATSVDLTAGVTFFLMRVASFLLHTYGTAEAKRESIRAESIL